MWSSVEMKSTNVFIKITSGWDNCIVFMRVPFPSALAGWWVSADHKPECCIGSRHSRHTSLKCADGRTQRIRCFAFLAPPLIDWEEERERVAHEVQPPVL